jgi:hypothetical protein
MELHRTTDRRPPERFAATAVPVDVLARLGSLLTDIANIKKSEPVKPALGTRNGAITVELSTANAGNANLDARVAVPDTVNS